MKYEPCTSLPLSHTTHLVNLVTYKIAYPDSKVQAFGADASCITIYAYVLYTCTQICWLVSSCIYLLINRPEAKIWPGLYVTVQCRQFIEGNSVKCSKEIKKIKNREMCAESTIVNSKLLHAGGAVNADNYLCFQKVCSVLITRRYKCRIKKFTETIHISSI